MAKRNAKKIGGKGGIRGKCSQPECYNSHYGLGLCQPHYNQQYRDKINERVRNRAASDRIRDREKQRKNRLWLLFRITPEEYDKILHYQKNHALFQILLGKTQKRDAVEHRHKDGLVRGVMANLLNRAYGAIERLYPENTSEILRALAEFHDNPPAIAALGSARYGLIGRAKSKKVMVYGPPIEKNNG